MCTLQACLWRLQQGLLGRHKTIATHHALHRGGELKERGTRFLSHHTPDHIEWHLLHHPLVVLGCRRNAVISPLGFSCLGSRQEPTLLERIWLLFYHEKGCLRVKPNSKGRPPNSVKGPPPQGSLAGVKATAGKCSGYSGQTLSKCPIHRMPRQTGHNHLRLL